MIEVPPPAISEVGDGGGTVLAQLVVPTNPRGNPAEAVGAEPPTDGSVGTCDLCGATGTALVA